MVLTPASILVTGANQGLGLELAKHWAKYANVKHIFACDKELDEGADLDKLTKSDSRLHYVKMDITCDSDIAQAKEKVEQILGKDVGLNLLINNAGIKHDDGAKFFTADRSVFTEHLQTNTISAVKVIQAFYPLLKIASSKFKDEEFGVHRSAVINISSMQGSITLNTLGSKAGEGYSNLAYRLSKAALNQVTRQLAADFAEDKILVVSICPGWMRTRIGGPTADYGADESAKNIIKTSLGFKKSSTGTFMNSFGEIYAF